jgi:ribosomal subunit interface protein
MQSTMQITYRGMESSEALNEQIKDEMDKLEKFFWGIVGAHVTIDQPHRHHRNGRHFRVRIELTVPGEVLVVGRDEEGQTSHENAFVAVTEAFDAMQRMLVKRNNRRRARREVAA